MRFRHLALLAFLLAGAGCGSGDSRSPASTTAPASWFEDVTVRSGVGFVHQVDHGDGHPFPALMAPGAAFLDFDNDGRLDVFLIHNVRPAGSASAGGELARNRLFHQQADGRFRDVSAGSGLEEAGMGNGIAAGDINNDGLPDVLVTGFDRVRLFVNRGQGRFGDVTAVAGLTNSQWSVPAAFVDYDRDGWLDVVIGNYLDDDPSQRCADARGRSDFCGPHGFRPTLTRLFRNRGLEAVPGVRGGPVMNTGGIRIPRFDDVTVSSGLSRAPGKAMQLLCADFDGDRWPDIFVTDDGLPNRLFLNRGDGTFAEEAIARGVAYTGMGTPAANMGIAIGDVDGNGLFDLFAPHLTEENHTLWNQRARGVFYDGTAAAGLLIPPWHGTGFGTGMADFDCDGDVDLAIVNGRVRRPLAGASARATAAPARGMSGIPAFWMPYAEPAQVFANNGSGVFTETSIANPALCGEAFVGRGLAMGDVDNDGGIDLLVAGIASPARLIRNNARRGHWIGVRVVDPSAGGRDAIGAEVTVVAGERRFWRLAHAASSYASSHDPRVHVGLGDRTRVDVIDVIWPDGTGEEFAGPPVDRYVTLKKGGGMRKPVNPQERIP